MKKYLQISYIIILFLLIPKLSFSTSWEFIKGPSVKKSITALEATKDAIYIGMKEKLFKSTDFGKTWTEIKYKDSLSFLYIIEIKILDSIIFINQDNIFFSFPHYQSLKSLDVGYDWKENNYGYQLQNVGFITKTGGNLYAHIFIKVGNQNRQITLKYDRINDKWVEIMDDTLYLKILNKPKAIAENKGKVYIGTEIFQPSFNQGYKRPNIFIYDTQTKELISVVDTLSDLWKSYINCFLVKGDDIFIGTSTGVYKSTDEGLTWTRKSNGLHFKNEYYDYDYEIHKMFEFEENLYAITNPPSTYGDFNPSYSTLVYSTDNGESWQSSQLFSYDVFVADMPQDFAVINNKLLISTLDGLFEVDKDLTKKTQLINDTLCSGTVQDFYVDNDKIYATKFNDFIYQKGLNKEERWEKLAKKQAFSNVDNFCKINQNIYALVGYIGNVSTTFVVSNDTGNTFRYVNGIDTTMLNIQYYSIYVHTNDSVYVTTSKGIFLSNDEGKTWQRITGDGFMYKVMKMLKIDENIFAGTYDYGLIKSVDGGKSWRNLKLPTKYDKITIKDVLYHDKKIYLATREGIFVSTDLGEIWEKKNNGYPGSLETASLASYGDYIFAATSGYGSVYYSTNGGEEWHSMNKGLSGYSLSRIRVFGDYLYAGTSTGLYRYNLKNLVVSVDDSQINVKPDYLWASVAYPNPARDYVQAKVWWDTHNEIEKAEIVVYDVYGNRVSGRDRVTIIPENDYSGLIRWDCSNFPSGVYILTIQHGTRIQTVRMLKE